MPRATPLPLDERRAALIAATEPLLQRHGREVSTRQIAEAAGVAEGTIFRAFPTKDALIDAVVEAVVDNQPALDAIGAIDPSLPLEDRMIAAVEVVQARLRRVFALFHLMRLEGANRSVQEMRSRHDHHTAQLNEAFVTLMMPDQARLRLAVDDAVAMLRMLTFTASHPLLGDPRLADPRRIVDLVLHGVLKRPQLQSDPTKGTSC